MTEPAEQPTPLPDRRGSRDVKPLRSPFRNGQVCRKWYHRLPYLTPWREYLLALKQQLAERGPLPADIWGSPERRSIAKTIEELLCEHCWGELLEFHPDDPWVVIGEWEVGDLSEAEVLMEVETAFAVVLPAGRELMELLGNGWTFGHLVSHIAKAANPAREPR